MHQNPQSAEFAATAATNLDLDLFFQTGPYDEQRYLAPYSPDQRFPELWGSVALRRAELGFPDGKPFVDCEPVDSLEAVEGRLCITAIVTEEDKLAFWRANFRAPDYIAEIKGAVAEQTGVTLDQHITDMWPRLTYHSPQDRGTLLGNRHPRLKSGERYSEGYYWDTADGLEGLIAEAEDNPLLWRQIFGELRNFADTIERFGHIPNGERSYYVSRSQPPKFAQMVRRVAESYQGGQRYDEIIEEFLPQVVDEYNWWTKGAARLDARAGVRAVDHSVLMPDGEVLERYWDVLDKPRPESEEEDWKLGQLLPEAERGQFYRNMRIFAECGRDMNGEMLKDPFRLETAIGHRTVPVDLNSILADTERMVAQAHDRAGRSVPAQEWHQRFETRVRAMLKYNVAGNEFASAFQFADDNFTHGAPTGYKSINMAHPVARGLFPPALAESTCRVMVDELLQIGGFIGSPYRTGHQWDAPNAWAPDQEEGQNALLKTAELTGNAIWRMYADAAKVRWVNHHGIIYRQLGKIAEKCSAMSADPLDVQDGEYKLQFGFLWTNGTLRKFLKSMVDCPTLFSLRTSNGQQPGNGQRLYLPR